jgi:RHS repeat-associated protein
MAKLVGDEHYSIITDHLDTPNFVFDKDGNQVWSADISVWGGLRNLQGDKDFCPFRYPGQYEDSETGLYYNRFHFYDPEAGRYVSQDPIGLDGGFNLHAYVVDPTSFIDPLGLSGCKADDNSCFEFNMIENSGPLAKLPNIPAANFANGKYNAITLTDDLILYRVGRGGGGKNAFGQWFTRTPLSSEAQGRLDLAIRPQWFDKNGILTGTSPLDSVYEIKIPKGTTIYEGPVGYQGGAYLGGQDIMQIYVDKPWGIDGVDILDEIPLRK